MGFDDTFIWGIIRKIFNFACINEKKKNIDHVWKDNEYLYCDTTSSVCCIIEK